MFDHGKTIPDPKWDPGHLPGGIDTGPGGRFSVSWRISDPRGLAPHTSHRDGHCRPRAKGFRSGETPRAKLLASKGTPKEPSWADYLSTQGPREPITMFGGAPALPAAGMFPHGQETCRWSVFFPEF